MPLRPGERDQQTVIPADPVKSALDRLASRIGPGVSTLSFRVAFTDGGSAGLAQCQVEAVEERDGGLVIAGSLGRLLFRWAFTPWCAGFWVTLDLVSEREVGCTRLDVLQLGYDPGVSVSDWMVPTIGRHVEDVGLLPVSELTARAQSGTLLRGAFPGPDAPGLFVGTRIPQRCADVLHLEQTAATRLVLTCSTELPRGLAESLQISAEAVWIDANRSLTEAVATYASHLPHQPVASDPPVGWNSWDYYYSSVSAADIAENVAAIARDPLLASRIRFIVIDMGWNHGLGEWFPNYRFPDGIDTMASRIAEHGYVPGIWTAPLLVDPLSATALRHGDFLVRNEHGDPQRTSGGLFMVDPTHPAGKAFLGEVYHRLWESGFRFFKVDFVDCLLEATRFHDPGAGHYDALRQLFALIRECVGDESHVLGCSLPPGCGPGIVDSGRIGIDIHNQWSHVEWAVDFLQLLYWLHRRIWINDVDFLVVRGDETSREAETTVLNPEAHNPRPPKWRRGPVFANLAEVQTWASIVALSGGSVFLSDRLDMLNDSGRQVVSRMLEPSGIAATPLDLGDGPRASTWLQEREGENWLTVINWTDSPVLRAVRCGAPGTPPPGTVHSFWTDEEIAVRDGQCWIELAPHASEILVWPRPPWANARREDGRA